MFSIIKIQNRCSFESEELTMKQQKFMLHQLILFIIVFLLGLLLVFTIGKCFFMNGIKVEAHNKNQKYFTTIEIEEGDTLWEIAKENRTEEYASIEAYIDEVKRTNHLESDQIEAGYSLLIPYYASEPRE